MEIVKPTYVVKRLPVKGSYLVLNQKVSTYINKVGKFWKPQDPKFPYFTTLRDSIIAVSTYP